MSRHQAQDAKRIPELAESICAYYERRYGLPLLEWPEVIVGNPASWYRACERRARELDMKKHQDVNRGSLAQSSEDNALYLDALHLVLLGNAASYPSKTRQEYVLAHELFHAVQRELILRSVKPRGKSTGWDEHRFGQAYLNIAREGSAVYASADCILHHPKSSHARKALVTDILSELDKQWSALAKGYLEEKSSILRVLEAVPVNEHVPRGIPHALYVLGFEHTAHVFAQGGTIQDVLFNKPNSFREMIKPLVGGNK
jgi:hypothetical protein